MNLSRYYIIIFVFPFLFIGSQFAQLSDSIAFSLDSSATYINKSNIYKSPTLISDDVFVVSPGFKVDFGAPYAGFDVSLKLSYDFVRYASLGDLDSEHLNSNLFARYQGSATNVNFSYNYIEGQSAQSSLIGQVISSEDEALIETESNYVNLAATYQYSPKLSFSTGVLLNKLDYATYEREYAPKENLTIPLNLNYQYSEKLSIIYGVEFTEREVGERYRRDGISGPYERISDAYDSDDVFYKIGLNGQLLPKLSGIMSLGYRTVEFSDNREESDKDTWAIDSKLRWAVTPKFNTRFGMRRLMDSAGSGDSYTTSRLFIGNTYDISPEFSMALNGDFSFKDYVEEKDRTDEINTYTWKLDYLPANEWVFSASYSFVDNRSHLVQYKAREFILSANFKY